jgi:hypothetical protein
MIWSLCLKDQAFLKNLFVSYAYDDFEGYTDTDPLSGLTGGGNWEAAYVTGTFAQDGDSFEGYVDNDDVNGLLGGVGWASGWVAS